MCGIIGYLGANQFVDYIISGLKLIQNRGYDSVGIGTINSKVNKLQIIKYASTNTFNSLDKVEQAVLSAGLESRIGIGHTRWATHGGKTDINAHPHTDSNSRIALVHNGIIENFAELKSELIKLGYKFKSSYVMLNNNSNHSLKKRRLNIQVYGSFPGHVLVTL